jgi:archaellum component FlaF (FlaF/FlaG flagellin family)
MKTTNTILTIIIIAVIVVGGFLLFSDNPEGVEKTPEATTTQQTQEAENTEVVSTTSDESSTSTSDEADETDEGGTVDELVIGQSVSGNDITAYQFGSGERTVLFAAGLHGGYEWNSSLLMFDLISWLKQNPDEIPDDTSVSVVPVVNPDGLKDVTGTTGRFVASDVEASVEETVPARFNANDVDLNRNFACNWQSTGQWQDRTVDAGTSAFSEPESQALRDYVNRISPDQAVVFYAAAGAVYSSECNGSATAATNNLMNTYAKGSGYPARGLYDAYEINGDAVNWMAKNDIPAISVLLSNHQDIEWEKNKAGIQAILNQNE